MHTLEGDQAKSSCLLPTLARKHRLDWQLRENIRTMNRYAGGLAVSLGPLLLTLACCGPSPQQRTTRLLDDRMQTQLASEINAGRAVVQQLPDGARVTLLDQSLFPNGPKALDDQVPDVRADVIEGLLDPSLMRVAVADTSALPADQRDTRIRNVEDYFTANGLGFVLVPAEAAPGAPGPAAAGPAGLTITVSVQCPPTNHSIGYGDGTAMPVCE
jgi:hypothetical protein